MDSEASSPEKSPAFPLQDVQGDIERTSHQPHDHAGDLEHARHHFRENNLFFLGMFLPVILLTVVAFTVDFGSTPLRFTLLGFHLNLGTGNLIAALVLAALRSGCIAYFLSHLFKSFSFVFRTLTFTVVFLIGMIFLSLWDSDIMPGTVGNPIWDSAHPESMHP